MINALGWMVDEEDDVSTTKVDGENDDDVHCDEQKGSSSDSDDDDMSSNASDNLPEYFSPASFPDIRVISLYSVRHHPTSSGE